jgi:hypothetical protein
MRRRTSWFLQAVERPMQRIDLERDQAVDNLNLPDIIVEPQSQLQSVGDLLHRRCRHLRHESSRHFRVGLDRSRRKSINPAS